MNENNIVDNNKEDINNILIKNNSNNEFLDNYSKKSDNENTEILLTLNQRGKFPCILKIKI
jgi:hypothetical protein